MNILLIIGVGVGLFIAFSVASFAVINYDLISYTATGSETYTPSGAPLGRALVVYSPGLSRAGKESAAKIARALNERGYAVDLAGVRSSTAADATSYDVVVMGGPLYWGKMCPSVAEYMEKVEVKEGARLGVFGTTGSDKYMEPDFAMLSEQIVSALGSAGASIPIKMVLTGQVDANCAELVSAVLQ